MRVKLPIFSQNVKGSLGQNSTERFVTEQLRVPEQTAGPDNSATDDTTAEVAEVKTQVSSIAKTQKFIPS